jgi:hypothetical protein
MRINGQYSGINVGPTSRLVFKYQKLTRKSYIYLRYSTILFGSIFLP